jgi:hypothetical protein
MVVQLKLKRIVTQILMEAEVPVDAPVDVTAVAIEVDLLMRIQNVDVDDAIIVELSNKVIELQAIMIH